MMIEPKGDRLVIILTRKLMYALSDCIQGRVRDSIPDTIYRIVEEYDYARIREAEIRENQLRELTASLPKPPIPFEIEKP